MRLNILGIEYEVIEYSDTQNTDPTLMGQADSKSGKIHVCKNMPAKIKRSTLLHEAIHIISDNLGLNLKESQVLGLETGLRDLVTIKTVRDKK